MSQAWVLGQRALREGWRTPEALLPTLFIPLFFLVVNVGQAAKIFSLAAMNGVWMLTMFWQNICGLLLASVWPSTGACPISER